MVSEKRRNLIQQTKKNKAAAKKKEAELAVQSVEDGLCLPWHSLIGLGIFVAVYVKCTSASIPSGDAGDFIISAHHFGVAHPPGYPLYVTLGHVWIKMLPFGSPAFKLNLLTSIIGGFAAFIVYITTYRLTRFVPSAILASSIFAFSHLTWFHSIGAEIFALNNLFCGILLYWVIRFQRAPIENRVGVAIEASFISGLSMSNQHTSILFIAVIGMWMFLSLLREEAISRKQFFQTGAAFLCGLLPYLQLPLSAFFYNPPSTWGIHKTLKGILRHMARADYGSLRLAGDERKESFSANFRMFTSDTVNELGILTVLLFVFCILTSRYFPSIKTVVNVYGTALTFYVLFFCKQANLDISFELMRGIQERFWMQSNLVVCLLGGCGLWNLYSLAVQKYPSFERHIYAAFSVLAILLASRQVATNFSFCDMSNNTMIENYGRRLIDELAPNSVLLVHGDVASYSARYLRYCEGYREDVDVLDQELLGYDWYKETHQHTFNNFIFPYGSVHYLWYTKLKASQGEKVDTFDYKDLFDVHSQAGIPVYLMKIRNKTGEGDDDGWKDHYELVQFDLVKEVRQKGNMSTPTLDEKLEKMESRNLTFHREDCDKSMYSERSWEWNIAKTSCIELLMNPPIVDVLQAIPNVYGEGHMLIENRPILIRIHKVLRKAQRALTFVDEQGKEEVLFGELGHYNLGVVSWMLFKNFKSTDEMLEGARYARVMVEQWKMFLAMSEDQDSRRKVAIVIKDTSREFPDLMTNKEYLL